MAKQKSAGAVAEYRVMKLEGVALNAFLPPGFPPKLEVDEGMRGAIDAAVLALAKLEVLAGMGPAAGWLAYGFVRKEGVVSSQMEGRRVTLREVLLSEVPSEVPEKEWPRKVPGGVEEVAASVSALEFARREISKPGGGMPVGNRFAREIHARMLAPFRDIEHRAGQVRQSQVWIGGPHPRDAQWTPPPPDLMPGLLEEWEKWLQGPSISLHPLVRVGLAYTQLDTIHPFYDASPRVARMLIGVLIEQAKFISAPLLMMSSWFKRQGQEYGDRLTKVRTEGDWEGWLRFFLKGVKEASEEAVATGQRLLATYLRHRQMAASPLATLPAVRLLDLLPDHPVMTMNLASKLLRTTKPTAINAVEALVDLKMLREVTGKKRGRVFMYDEYVTELAEEVEQPAMTNE